jgi:purine-binding chemotaxis protein CheW
VRTEARGQARRSAPPEEGLPHLVFEAGGVRCLLPLLAVREIVGLREVPRPAEAPEALRGVMELRGARVPVVDLAVALGGGAAADAFESCALVVEVRGPLGPLLGLAVAAVTGVAALAPGLLAPAPRVGGLFDRSLVEALARVDETFLPVLALPEVLASPAVRAAVGAARAAA